MLTMTNINRILTIAAVLIAASFVYASTARAVTPTRNRLWAATDRYSSCRHGGFPTFHGSATARAYGTDYETAYSADHAGLDVYAGKGSRMAAVWFTRYPGHVRIVLFHFAHLRNVAARLRALAANFPRCA